MFGNLVNKNQLLELVKENVVSITPFNERLMQIVHYPLKPGGVSIIEQNGDLKQIHNYSLVKKPFAIQPNQYVVIDVAESIKMPTEGIVGQFIPTSTLITKGLSIICGKINSPYGMGGEKTIFGLKNFTEHEILLKPDEVIAYVQFFDLRGLKNDEYQLTQKELEEWVKRRRHANDDGVHAAAAAASRE